MIKIGFCKGVAFIKRGWLHRITTSEREDITVAFLKGPLAASENAFVARLFSARVRGSSGIEFCGIQLRTIIGGLAVT